MKVVLQRVSEASVSVDGVVVGAIGLGYLALVGIADGDDEAVVDTMARRAAGIRLFPNPDEPQRKPIDAALDVVGGAVLAVSQFTLCADTSRGRRPSFIGAAAPEVASRLFDRFVEVLRGEGVPVETGRFGASMRVSLVNEGPVTILLDS